MVEAEEEDEDEVEAEEEGDMGAVEPHAVRAAGIGVMSISFRTVKASFIEMLS